MRDPFDFSGKVAVVTGAASGLGKAEKILLDRLSGTEVVLLKASRGVAMERLIPALERRFAGRTPAGA